VLFRSPLIPGTFGSLAGILIYYLVKDLTYIYLAVAVGLTLVGFWAAGRAEGIFQKKDSRLIVIDEVAGMLLSLLFLPYDLRLVVIGFFLFRLLDTLKPYPAGRLQELKGGAGVMLDDLVAAVYTNILLQIVWRVAFCRGS
jgi:phosphatidylglycerophosphatase A